jgi:hypothetical protein
MSSKQEQRATAEDDEPNLRAELEALRERVATLEAQVSAGPSTLPSVASDYRDARVLEALDEGDKVHLHELRELYLDRTDIRDDATLRARIKDIAQSDAFERAGTQCWRYCGSGGE